MTNNIRVFLWLGLALALWLNYSQWQQDYGPKPTAAVAANTATDGSKQPALDDTVPRAPQISDAAPTPAATQTDGVPVAPGVEATATTAAPATATAGIVH